MNAKSVPNAKSVTNAMMVLNEVYRYHPSLTENTSLSNVINNVKGMYSQHI